MITPPFLRQLRAAFSTRTPRAFCLMFHRVVDDPSNTLLFNQRVTVSSKAFEKTISHIAQNFRPLPMDEFVSKMEEGRLPLNAVSVTFDDGYRDNLYTALPFLERYEIPATVYVTTGFVDGSVRAFEYDLAGLVASESYLEFDLQSKKTSWELKSAEDRSACYEYIRSIVKYQTFEQRKKAMSQLTANRTSFQEPANLYLNWEELKGLASSPLITIGGHTHHHLVLSCMDHSNAYADISMCRTVLIEQLDCPIRHFSYPYGEYNPKTIDLVREAGFESAVTTTPSGIRKKDVNIFAIPRIEIVDETIETGRKA